MKRQSTEAAGTVGRSTPVPTGFAADDTARAAIIADVKRQLADEMGLLPLNLLRDRSTSFVELYSYDHGSSSYGTAGYLGEDFITVKHGVVALSQEGQAEPRNTPR